MKKIFLSAISGLLLLGAGTGCLKDKNFEAQQYGTQVLEKKAVAFAESKDGVIFSSVNSQATPLDLVGPVITLEQSGNATTEITVTIELNPAAIAQANTDDPDLDLVELPADAYTLNATTFKIAPGEKLNDKLKITMLNTSTLDPTTTYSLGFKIKSVDNGYGIAANLQNAVLGISIKNKYDGVYSYSGTIFRNSATGPDPALSGSFTNLAARSLVTLGANSVSLVPLWANGGGIGGIDNTLITVDPNTNLVTMSCGTNPTLRNTPGAENKYDPDTKTFTLAFDWGTGANTRVTTMTLKYLRPR